MVDKEENPRLKRVGVIYGIVFFSLATLVFRLAFVQIVNGSTFRENATTSMLARFPILPSRGWIYDTNNRLLAYNQPSFSVILTKLSSRMQNLESIANRLAPVFHTTSSQLYAQITSPAYRGITQFRIYKDASKEQMSYVIEHQRDLPGVHIIEEPKRVYPYGDLACHVLGYVHSQPASEAKKYAEEKYQPDQWVGIDGVERQYESQLRGQVGYRSVEVNSLGIPLHDFGLDPAPIAGNRVQLTIDAHLQAHAQQIMVDELALVRKKYGYDPQDAEAVMLDTRTGGVLAMVSYPYYNPDWFMTSKAYALHAKYLWGSKTPMVNHVLQSPRAPGSTVKPVNILAGLQAGVITPYTTLDDHGHLNVGTYVAKDWQKWGHGQVGPVTAIRESCDTFMYQLGMWMANWHDGLPWHKSFNEWNSTDRVKGYNRMFEWERKFGLGPKTGIDLPNESAGRFYTDVQKRGLTYVVPYDLNRAEHELSSTGKFPNTGLLYDNAFAAIGQMQQFTPMELGEYIMTIANRGKRIAPHVVKAIYSPSGERIQTVKPTVEESVPVTPQLYNVILQGMYEVVNDPRGTAYASFANAPYHAAGKTGTAQQGGGRGDISLFVGFAPAEHPEVCVAVMVPGGGESGETAVPIGRNLFDAYFKEHHQFFPSSQYTGRDIPKDWAHYPASTIPEQATQ